MSQLSLVKVSKSYKKPGRDLAVLENIDLKVKPGEFVCVIGPNGCGKSTLLKIIAGIVSQSSGKLKIPTNLAYLPQQPSLLPWRTVKDNLFLASDMAGQPRASIEKRAGQLLKDFALDKFGDFYPASISGGMQQKVALIRSILLKPELILLDEPFSALDSITRIKMQSWLLDLWQKDTPGIVCVTHDISEAIFMADKIYVMGPRPGRIIASFNKKTPGLEQKLKGLLI